MNKLKVTFSEIAVVLLMVELILNRLSVWDCLAAAVVVVWSQSEKVVDYLFPKRPDVFNEIQSIRSSVEALQDKSSDLERDVTALKFGQSVRKPK